MACLLPFRGVKRHAVACAARVATCRAPHVAQSSVWPAARCLHSQAAPSTLASLTEPDPDVVQTVWPRARQPWSGKNGAAAGHAYLDDSQLWLVTHDLQATLEFYGHVLGWKLRCRYGNDWAEVYGPGNITLGFQARPDAASMPKVGIALTTGTTNHEVAARHLEHSGVRVSDPIPAGPALRREYTDPNGYTCSMIAFADGDKNATQMGQNGYGNVQMRVPDLDAAHEFYVNKLAFTLLSREPGWLQLEGPGGVMLGFGEDKTPADQRPAPSGWRLGVSTSNLETTRAALEKAGVATLQDELEAFGPVMIKLLRFQDPSGAPLVAVGKV